MEKLKNAHYTDDIKWPTSLISIEELSEKTGVTTPRLQERLIVTISPTGNSTGGLQCSKLRRQKNGLQQIC